MIMRQSVSQGDNLSAPTNAYRSDDAERTARQREMKARIVAAAEQRFRSYGYGKTTVAEIAADLGFSPAYIYKFYNSKIAVCEAVCGSVLERIDRAVWDVAARKEPAPERLRRVYCTLLEQSISLFFSERKLHDMVREGIHNHWESVERHKAALESVVRFLILQGRDEGAFDTTRDLERDIYTIYSSLIPFAHPAVLDSAINTNLPERCQMVAEFMVEALSVPPRSCG